MSEVDLSDSKPLKNEICSKIDMDLWPLLSLVSPSLQSKVKLVYVFGQSGSEMIFTTTNDKVNTFKDMG